MIATTHRISLYDDDGDALDGHPVAVHFVSGDADDIDRFVNDHTDDEWTICKVGPAPAALAGFSIQRIQRRHLVEFAVMEDGKDRPALVVESWPEELSFHGGPQISWPSTSDKRPVLALALAEALTLAAKEAIA